MNVPTVRPRLAPGLDEENAGTDYAVNPMKPEVLPGEALGSVADVYFISVRFVELRTVLSIQFEYSGTTTL